VFISDSEVKQLAAISAMIAPDYAPDANDPWLGSPFKWIKSQPSRTVGAIGEKLVSGWCAAKGFDVTRSPDSEADRLIQGRRIEIKFSTLWANGGYKFQQIRDQDYEYCFCLGVSPFDAHAWLIPKDALLEYVIGHMGQHTGAQGSDTAWLGFQVGQEFSWMKEFGGNLAAVKKLLDNL
jgi:hypothetical protein